MRIPRGTIADQASDCRSRDCGRPDGRSGPDGQREFRHPCRGGWDEGASVPRMLSGATVQAALGAAEHHTNDYRGSRKLFPFRRPTAPHRSPADIGGSSAPLRSTLRMTGFFRSLRGGSSAEPEITFERCSQLNGTGGGKRIRIRSRKRIRVPCLGCRRVGVRAKVG